MGIAGSFTPEKLVMGILCSRPDREGELRSALSERWGAIDYWSEPIPFTFTHYYDSEMGQPLVRRFAAFERLVDPACLSEVKRETNALEERFREDGGRRVNLDPGLLALSRFVLATTKESAHRLPLSNGIYAEVTLLYAHGGFRPLQWTYPDFRSAAYLSILSAIRSRYREQLPG
ncbi:MAG TPA: DUF4416 family protein [Spirochaetia bacterium]|nr:DUF4416 family protein [Spirochaetia bacterium]